MHVLIISLALKSKMTLSYSTTFWTHIIRPIYYAGTKLCSWQQKHRSII